MLSCFYISGVLMLSGGGVIMPLESLNYIEQRKTKIVAVSRGGQDLTVDRPEGSTAELELRRCAAEAEAEVMAEQGGD